MRRLLFLLHRWLGIALAPLLLIWFVSGLAMLYASPSAVTTARRLAHEEPLRVGTGWLTLREATDRNAAPATNTIASARLVRQAGKPWWLITDNHGRRFRLSAIDGSSHDATPQTALAVARTWAGRDGPAASFVATVAGDSGTRMYTYDPYRPFQQVALHDKADTVLLVSARTGQVIRAANRIERALTLAGGWLHFLRPLDSIGLPGARRPLLAWGDFALFFAVLSGLIVGWLRWRPGWFNGRRYSGNRVHPYRRFWPRWHFWSGLIGGVLALAWTFSGFLAVQPWHLFSPPRPTVAETARYLGGPPPAAMLDWRPSAAAAPRQAVELLWRHVGSEAVLIAYDHNGTRYPLNRSAKIDNAATVAFGTATLQQAARRMVHNQAVRSSVLQQDYDAYYYPTHRHDIANRPLPVLRIDFGDAGHTRLYVDPLDGRVVAKFDRSRQIYRWLFSALHSWDIGWLYRRPLWDGWMVPWLLLGIVLSVTSFVVGWKRLARTRIAGRRPAPTPQPAEES